MTPSVPNSRHFSVLSTSRLPETPQLREIKLSVIVPCYNAEDTLAALLKTLERQEWDRPWEVIISENGSTDRSVSVAESFLSRLPNLRIVRATARRGVAHARNTGVEAAAGDVIVFCDADDEVGTGWLAEIGGALDHSDMVASRHDFEKLNRSWTQRNLKWLTQQHKLQRTRFHPHLQHAGTGGLGVKRSVYLENGGLDEELPVLSDVDFCLRAQLNGASISFVPGAVVYVRKRANLRNSFKQARVWAMYNVLMYRRYHTPSVKFQGAWRLYLFYWLQFLGDLKHARCREDYAKLVWFFGWQLGLLQGAIRFWGPPLPI